MAKGMHAYSVPAIGICVVASSLVGRGPQAWFRTLGTVTALGVITSR